MNESVVVYRRFMFFRVALYLCLAAIIAYAWHRPLGMPNGGTWLGYGLGSIGAILILWLMYLGIRKRTYGPGKVKLEAWVSAHIYLGLSLLVIVTLHTGFRFGMNLHTLAYALMLVVIASGCFGLYAYLRYPLLMTENRRGITLDNMLAQIADIDRECREVSMQLGEEINRAVLVASQNTRIGGGVLQQLSGVDPKCPTSRALKTVEQMAGQAAGNQAGDLRRLSTLLTRKEELLRRARRDVQIVALMRVWLFVHVPVSFALLAALIAHVVSVFFYW